MKHAFIVAIMFLSLTGLALAQQNNDSTFNRFGNEARRFEPQQGFQNSWDNETTFARPYKNDAYGPGIHSDGTGKSFQWKTRDGQIQGSGKIVPDGYGLGVGRDRYGRPVKPSPLNE